MGGDNLRKTDAEIRKSLADPTYTADDYEIDEAIKAGPLHNRKCTDILCLLIFIVALIGGGYVAVYSYENGNPERIMRPMDADGNFCGKTPGYEDYPYLYYTNIESTFWLPYGVCVSRCPASPSDPIDCVPT